VSRAKLGVKINDNNRPYARQQNNAASVAKLYSCSLICFKKKKLPAVTDVTLINSKLRAVLIYICNKTSLWATRGRVTPCIKEHGQCHTSEWISGASERLCCCWSQSQHLSTIHHGAGHWGCQSRTEASNPNNIRWESAYLQEEKRGGAAVN